MKKLNGYYEVTSLSRNPSHPLKDWYEEAKKESICPGCFSVKENMGAIDVYLSSPPENCSFNFVSGIGIGYAHRNFLSQIGIGEIGGEFYVGNVFDHNGAKLSELSTFRDRKPLIIRGNTASPSRHCEICGTLIYHPMGKRYLSLIDLTDRLVYENQMHQFIFEKHFFDSIDKSEWRKVGKYNLPVL